MMNPTQTSAKTVERRQALITWERLDSESVEEREATPRQMQRTVLKAQARPKYALHNTSK
jgi:hypothetical protein